MELVALAVEERAAFLATRAQMEERFGLAFEPVTFIDPPSAEELAARQAEWDRQAAEREAVLLRRRQEQAAKRAAETARRKAQREETMERRRDPAHRARLLEALRAGNQDVPLASLKEAAKYADLPVSHLVVAVDAALDPHPYEFSRWVGLENTRMHGDTGRIRTTRRWLADWLERQWEREANPVKWRRPLEWTETYIKSRNRWKLTIEYDVDDPAQAAFREELGALLCRATASDVQEIIAAERERYAEERRARGLNPYPTDEEWRQELRAAGIAVPEDLTLASMLLLRPGATA